MSNHENYRNEIKAYIVRAGMTMSEVVEILADEYGSVFSPESRMKIAKSLPSEKWAYLRKMFISTNSPARISSVRSIRNCCEE